MEPLDLPADPALAGVPVGVRTVSWSGLDIEVWYPASDDTSGPTEEIDYAAFAPASVLEELGGLEVPQIETQTYRDAEVRNAPDPFPVVIFSHGFGGTRHQSVDMTSHLASRGYVVVATDHAGRALGDLLPCLFLPPLEGCEIAFEDPAPSDIDTVLAWLDAGPDFLKGAIDLELLGIFGHSAGGATTGTMANEEPRFKAAMPMAGTTTVTRDMPVLDLLGDCDGVVLADDIRSSNAESQRAGLVEIAGAGHLAFSDLCTIDLAALDANYLEGRDGVSDTFRDLLLNLGTDGCPPNPPVLEGCDSYLDLEVSTPILRHVVTAFFDRHLLEQGEGVVDGVFPEVTVTPVP